MRCEKARLQCPGYRDLGDHMFRDESGKTVEKAQRSTDVGRMAQTRPVRAGDVIETAPAYSRTIKNGSSSSLSLGRSSMLCPPLTDMGASFFFSTYHLDEPPFSGAYYSWITKAYNGDQASHGIRAAIEAAGMAGLANVLHAPQIASKSRAQYARALVATQRAMNDPTEVTTDETLLAVILLGLFEVCPSMLRYWEPDTDPGIDDYI